MKIQRLAVLLPLAAALAACNNPLSQKDKLDTDTQKLSYAIGVDIGRTLAPLQDDLDLESLERGLSDVQMKHPLLLDDAARQAIKMKMAQEISQKHMKQAEADASKNTDAGKKYLADNGKRAGVTTTASGLEYEVLKAGSGDHPKPSDLVQVNYKGTLLDGTTFDSSYDRGQPATFRLDQVIPGWTEGLQLMTPGSKYRFVIPSNLAYGEQGAGDKIGPNATLVFEVELLAINPKQ